MNPIVSEFDWRRLSPVGDDFEYFFGYYDRNPWNDAEDLHLTLKVPPMLRLPERGERAEIGVLDRAGRYESLTTTRCWCHQQGSMTLFLPGRGNTFIYNDYDEKHSRVIARIFRIGEGVAGEYDFPVYAISPDGRYGVSLDFGRIPRRGYSYADAALSADAWPRDLDGEGIRLIDLATGKSRVIAGYRTMIELHPVGYGLEGARLWLNHAIFNCDSSRLLWLFRHCDESKPRQGLYWKTFMYTCDLDGSDVECVLPQVYWNRMISHQIWGRTPREILVDADWDGAGHGAVVFDESRKPFLARKLSPSHGRMSHMVFSPDGKYILADGYPVNGRQLLLLIDAASGQSVELGSFRHELPEGTIEEVRCDLHPRWSRDGRICTVDSIAGGRRAIYLLELDDAKAKMTISR